MKHVKVYDAVTSRNYKIFYKYHNYLNNALDLIGADLIIYREDNRNYIDFNFKNIYKDDYIKLGEYFKDFNFQVNHNRYYIKFHVNDVPQSFFDHIDLEMKAKRYNL